MPALMAVISGTSVPLKREMDDVMRAARRAGMVLEENLNPKGGGHGGPLKSGVIRELLVLLREIGSGNWTRVPGSLSLLIQRMGMLKFLINPITIGFVAMGTAAFFVIRHFMKLREEAKNLADLMDITTIKFSEQSALMKKSIQEAQAFNDWLRNLGKSEQNLGDQIQETLRGMREKARLERELAAEGGASKKKLADMDIAELQKEVHILEVAKREAHRQIERDKRLTADAEKRRNDVTREGQLKKASDSAAEMARIVDALKEKVKTQRISELGVTATGDDVMIAREATAEDVFSVNVGGKDWHMSQRQAEERHKELEAAELRLAREQKGLADTVEARKKKSQKDEAEEARVNKELREARTDLRLKQQYLPKLAEEAVRSRVLHGNVTSLQGVGGYTSPASIALIDTAKKSEHHLKTIRDHVVSRAHAGSGMRRGKF